jgi:hypothetical protein
VWDGTEVLFIGGRRAGATALSADGVGFNPAISQWRRLPAMELARRQFATAWTGRRLVIWGGLTGDGLTGWKVPPHWVAYDPTGNRWLPIPMSPLRGRGSPTAAWTGCQMIVWGGTIPGTQKDTQASDGAAYQPA